VIKPSVLTGNYVENFAAAVFDKSNPLVLEAYSEFDKDPLQFVSKNELVQHINDRLSVPHRTAHFFVTYPDMLGYPIKRTIHLDQKRVRGGKVRHTWGGWGLISVIIENEETPTRKSHVAANSEARANMCCDIHPELPLPSSWNWQAVGSHLRRLQRVLKMGISNSRV
jgi:hypothetical protein